MNRDLLEAELTRDEGLRLKPYRCTAGKLTIGVGRNLEDSGISEDEAGYLLRNDIARIESELDDHLPWWRDLRSDARQRVLANMAFNLGIGGLLKFQRMLVAAKNGNYEIAANEMLGSLWARQVGNRATRLANMMRAGGSFLGDAEQQEETS